MRPVRWGRALGIGVRLASDRILPPPAAPRSPSEQQRLAAQRVQQGERLGRQARSASQSAAQSTRTLARGSRGFGRAVWNPLAHASSVLWLEITGSFFAVFALLFLDHLWTLRRSYRSGPEHAHFLVYAGFATLFLYFAATSFARARRRARPRR
ncbi:hypothetical protein [Acidipila sp. EB88]|uniref:hypothetical protein n=1 Tax=Acidipila sp. EB88 TaxID=2305226 RepID=UPI000F5F006F|nr:hypothetical protein [Acidipila sp. EB88]RRA47566.1 hypothetical protein D1Y84_03890 [Acidipila sp. EB88]